MTPEQRAANLHAAGREGLRNRLRDAYRLPEATADAWCEAWEAEAERQGIKRGSPGFWAKGADWILPQVHP